MKTTMIEGALRSGALLKRRFGQTKVVRIKENPASVVTEADLESEQALVELIRGRFPDHGILGEEGGHMRHGSRFTWVLDPLDGTSNFASGLPWFGVMIALLDGPRPILGCLHLPMEDRTYVAEAGGGATCNGEPIRVTESEALSTMLCACAMDPSANSARVEQQAAFMARLVQASRNLRATNSLVDFAATADGRLGACVNFNVKLWDIAAPSLVMSEAGGTVLDLSGAALDLDLGPQATERSYAVIGGSKGLVRQVLRLATASGLA